MAGLIWAWTHLLPTLSGVTFLEAAEEGEEAADDVVEEVMIPAAALKSESERPLQNLPLPR